VDDDPRTAQPGVEVGGDLVAEDLERVHLEAHPLQVPGGDQAVAAVVPLAAENADGALREELGDDLGKPRARRLPQIGLGDAPRSDRPACGRPHLPGVVERLQPGLHQTAPGRAVMGASPWTATAAANSREWVSETATGSPPAASAARPERLTAGGSPATIS